MRRQGWSSKYSTAPVLVVRSRRSAWLVCGRRPSFDTLQARFGSNSEEGIVVVQRAELETSAYDVVDVVLVAMHARCDRMLLA